MDFNFSYPVITGKQKRIEISKENFILIKNYRKGASEYSIVSLHLKNQDVFFIGSFNEEFDNLNVKYKDGRILVYCGVEKISKVLSLYDIVDSTFYSCSEKEALNIFDPNIDDSILKESNSMIWVSDIKKKKTLK